MKSEGTTDVLKLCESNGRGVIRLIESSGSPEPFFFPGNDVGVLLVHGFTGSCAEMRLLGHYLHQQYGYTVHAPLLKGHGTRPEDLEQTTEDDWWESVLAGYKRVKKNNPINLFAIGLSMGGLLSLKLATRKPVRGVVSLAAPIFVNNRWIALSRWVHYVYRYRIKCAAYPEEIEQLLWSYDRMPIKSVARLYHLIQEVKQLLPTVEVPALIMQGKKDQTVLPKSAQYIADAIRSVDKQLVWYDHSDHILTIDRDREDVFQEIAAFISRCLRQQ